MTNQIAEAIANFANPTQVHRNGNWVQQDTLAFHRTKLMEKMLDQLSWSTQQASRILRQAAQPRDHSPQPIQRRRDQHDPAAGRNR